MAVVIEVWLRWWWLRWGWWWGWWWFSQQQQQQQDGEEEEEEQERRQQQQQERRSWRQAGSHGERAKGDRDCAQLIGCAAQGVPLLHKAQLLCCCSGYLLMPRFSPQARQAIEAHMRQRGRQQAGAVFCHHTHTQASPGPVTGC